MIVFLDGNFIEESHAFIPVADRGFLFGDGVYETIQIREGHPLFLPEHLKRFETNCKTFRIVAPEINEKTINEIIERNRAQQGVYKLQIMVTGGQEPMRGLPPRQYGHLLIKMAPFATLPSKPLFCLFYPEFVATPHSHVKTLAHLNRYFIADFARLKGADDAVTRGEKGIILEASFANLFWIVGDELFTPHKELPLHFGVTISKVVEMASELGFKAQEVACTLEEIPAEAHLFRVSSMANIKGIWRLEERLFPVDPCLEEKLNDALDRETVRIR